MSNAKAVSIPCVLCLSTTVKARKGRLKITRVLAPAFHGPCKTPFMQKNIVIVDLDLLKDGLYTAESWSDDKAEPGYIGLVPLS